MKKEVQLIVPVKRLEEAKTSLSEVLSEDQRKELTLAMIMDVLESADRVEEVSPMVVTPDEDVVDFVEEKNVECVLEPGVGLNRALELAIEESMDSGFEKVLIVPSDIPLIRPKDIRKILDLASEDKNVVITPSKENGTNALFLQPPDVIDLKFGGKSFPDHVKEARSRKIKPRIYRSENVERDIDHPSDLLKAETLGKGTKTHSFLDSLK